MAFPLTSLLLSRESNQVQFNRIVWICFLSEIKPFSFDMLRSIMQLDKKLKTQILTINSSHRKTKPKMAYSRKLSNMAIMNSHGLI